MDGLIDLDAAAAVASSRIEAWRGPVVQVEPLTWRDAAQPWPQRLSTDRQQVIEPDSLGLRVRGGDQEGTLVVFRGGWADLTYVDLATSVDPVVEAVGWEEPLRLEDYGLLVDRFLGLFR